MPTVPKAMQNCMHPRKRLYKIAYDSTAPGATATITTRAATIKAAATKATTATLPRLAGNLPRRIQYWLSTKRWNPTKRINTATPMKVVPRGFPRFRRRSDAPVIPKAGS